MKWRENPFFQLSRRGQCMKSLQPYQTFLFDPILDPLNSAQKEAVLHQGSHLLIVAGPGTGKTMTLTHRMAYQIRSQLASAEDILSLTFTNKAAAEMRKRLTALLPDEHGDSNKGVHLPCLLPAGS